MGDVDPRRDADAIGQHGPGEVVGLRGAPVEDSDRSAASDLDPDSAALLADLTAAIGDLDAAPPALVQAAKDSWAWRTIDAELAALVSDSVDSGAVTRAGDEAPRTLTFAAGSTAVVLEVSAVGRTRRLLGQIVRPRRTQVEVRTARGSQSVTTDELGRFRVDGIPSGPVSLICRFLDSAGRAIATSWVAV